MATPKRCRGTGKDVEPKSHNLSPFGTLGVTPGASYHSTRFNVAGKFRVREGCWGCFSGSTPTKIFREFWCTLPEANSKFIPENGCLEYKPFLLGKPIFRGYVSFREGIFVGIFFGHCRVELGFSQTSGFREGQKITGALHRKEGQMIYPLVAGFWHAPRYIYLHWSHKNQLCRS